MNYYILCVVLVGVVSVAKSEDDMKSICFDEKLGSSVCKCEYLYPDAIILSDLHSEVDAKLTCVGEDSLEMSVETLTFNVQLIFLELVITSGTVDMVENIDLQHFPKLRNLSLSDNRISSFGVGPFKNQVYLERLDLSVNNLTRIVDSMFETLTHLKNITLSHNQIYLIENKVFSNLHNVVYIDLSYNQLPSVDCNLFSGTRILQSLILKNNKIAYINGSFHLLHLQLLDLSFNNLKQVQSVIFFRLKNLKFLSLAMNELTTLDESTFKGNVNLQKVNLTGKVKISVKFR